MDLGALPAKNKNWALIFENSAHGTTMAADLPIIIIAFVVTIANFLLPFLQCCCQCVCHVGRATRCDTSRRQSTTMRPGIAT